MGFIFPLHKKEQITLEGETRQSKWEITNP
jgi:hypothetical protein